MKTQKRALVGLWLLLSSPSLGVPAFSTLGLVLRVDVFHRQLLVSCQEVPGILPAKILQVSVQNPQLLNGLRRGNLIDLTLSVSDKSAYASNIQIHEYNSAEREPANARRLRALDNALGRSGLELLRPGESVPNFALIDQNSRLVSLQQFRGKMVVVNFVYTRCALPNYCYRLSNNFGVLQKREQARLGHDLVLLTVTFDPVHDRPENLLNYAKTWNADLNNWRFLTGAEADVERVCAMFGVNAFSSEGLFVHSLHTALIDRDGKLVANLEGNQFTAQQLGDLVEASLN
ncbi:MAG: SCO family protein [Acidobacteria bacterium]|nr:SCO family protein [Acidobacteriota bacterium]